MTKRILNLGAGTQSSVLALMCDRGDVEPVDVAIFADTMAEPDEVYEHLRWLEKQLKRTPVVTVREGNLEKDAIAFRQRGADSGARMGHASIPLFILNPDGTRGMVRRQCTYQYKVVPIERYIRRTICGLSHGQRMPADVVVTQLFGISFDERQRMREPRERWLRFQYPLVDRKLTRESVVELGRRWFPDHVFPRSACTFCPYKSNSEWRRLRDHDPKGWESACTFDEEIRRAGEAGQQHRKLLVGKPFVHSSLVPLRDADLRSDDEKTNQITFAEISKNFDALNSRGQTAPAIGIENECEGMCGV